MEIKRNRNLNKDILSIQASHSAERDALSLRTEVVKLDTSARLSLIFAKTACYFQTFRTFADENVQNSSTSPTNIMTLHSLTYRHAVAPCPTLTGRTGETVVGGRSGAISTPPSPSENFRFQRDFDLI